MLLTEIPQWVIICMYLHTCKYAYYQKEGAMTRGGFIPKSKCPKCGGSMYMDNDFYGWFEHCLQCGYTYDLAKITEIRDKLGNANTTR
jgi:Zn ribbon nucleic-acid-binding protein